jgi:hypothetical protein
MDDKVWEGACHCGRMRIRLAGDPEYVSSCCCEACQRRTGSFFGVTAFFRDEQVLAKEGEWGDFRRTAESGATLDFHFCRSCGSTVWWEPQARPGRICVSAGMFADPAFPAPQRMIWTDHRHPWVTTPEDLPLYATSPG